MLSRSKRALLSACLALPALCAAVGAAHASGMGRSCATPTGEYVIQADDKLRPAKDENAEGIAFRKLEEIVISHTKGHCAARAADFKGKRYTFERKDYLIKVEFVSPETKKKATEYLVCWYEYFSDPVAADCGPQVPTSRRVLVPTYRN